MTRRIDFSTWGRFASGEVISAPQTVVNEFMTKTYTLEEEALYLDPRP